jgi:hypothetical protein
MAARLQVLRRFSAMKSNGLFGLKPSRFFELAPERASEF